MALAASFDISKSRTWPGPISWFHQTSPCLNATQSGSWSLLHPSVPERTPTAGSIS